MIVTHNNVSQEYVSQVADLYEAFSADDTIALDLETGGLSPWKDPIAVISLYGAQSKHSALLHVRGRIGHELKAWFSSRPRLFVTHNGVAFDIPFLATHGVDWKYHQWYDTLIGEQVTLSTGRRDVKVNLQATLSRRVGIRIAKGLGKSTWMAPVLTPEQITYCLEDIAFLPSLREAQIDKVRGSSRVKALDFENHLSRIVVDMTLFGLPFSVSRTSELGDQQESIKYECYRYLQETLGALNYNSPKQVLEAFKQRYGILLESTDAETLAALREHEGELGKTAGSLLDYRYANKRITMYDEEWMNKYVHESRVHPRFRSVGTDTGRFSSSDPNIQQIPKSYRSIIGNLEGHKIVSADYSSIEVVVAAAIAQDKVLLADIASGTDIHRTIASELFNKPQSEITSTERRIAKASTFSLIFAGSAKAVMRRAVQFGSPITEQEATMLRYRFLQRYKGIALTHRQAQEKANSGYPVTIVLPTGLKRVLANASPSQIVNTVVQGTAAAGLKYALLKMEEQGLTKYLGAVVHDEIVATVPDAEAQDYAQELSRCMIAGMAEVVDADVRTESSIDSTWA